MCSTHWSAPVPTKVPGSRSGPSNNCCRIPGPTSSRAWWTLSCAFTGAERLTTWSPAPRRRTSTTANATSGAQDGPLRGPACQRIVLEAALDKALPAAQGIADQQVGMSAEIMLGIQRSLRRGHFQTLLEGRFDSVQQLVDAGLQARIFVHQGVAHQHPRQAAVLLRKAH